MSIGWFIDIDDAQKYFDDERPFSEWEHLTDDKVKTGLINYAYNRLYHSPLWTLPTFAAASAEQLVELRIINGEMVNYLAIHLAAEDRRKGIQAQGVGEASLGQFLKETYVDLDGLPIPANVKDMLKKYETAKSLLITDIDRDEDYGVDETSVVDVE
jgi:hypothetical protein